MRLLISSLFVEPEYYFDVSPNIDTVVAKEIEKNLVPSKLFIKKYKGFDIGFTISTKREIESLYIQGPTIFKAEKQVDFTIWMPYEQIYLSSNYLESYLNNLFEGILLGLNKYEFQVKILESVFIKVKKEILDNPDIYTYQREPRSIDEMLDDIEIFE